MVPVIGPTRSCIHHPHVIAQSLVRRTFSSRIPLSCVKGGGRRGTAMQYIPEVAVQHIQSMYSRPDALLLRRVGRTTTLSKVINTSFIMGKRFASEVTSGHRTNYAATVVGGGPAGITVCLFFPSLSHCAIVVFRLVLGVEIHLLTMVSGCWKPIRKECQAHSLDRRSIQSRTSQ